MYTYLCKQKLKTEREISEYHTKGVMALNRYPWKSKIKSTRTKLNYDINGTQWKSKDFKISIDIYALPKLLLLPKTFETDLVAHKSVLRWIFS